MNFEYTGNKAKLIKDTIVGNVLIFVILIVVFSFFIEKKFPSEIHIILGGSVLLTLWLSIYKVVTSLEYIRIDDYYIEFKRISFMGRNNEEFRVEHKSLYDLGVKRNEKNKVFLIILRIQNKNMAFENHKLNVVYVESEELIQKLIEIVDINYENDMSAQNLK